MSRENKGGHIRTLGGKTKYRLIRVMIDGSSKQLLEHRHVMEQHLGRKLHPHEVVHHIDGDGLNNSIGNLELMTQSAHQNEHLMTGPRKWPLEEAINLHESGEPLCKIAERYGVSWTSIRAAFHRRGIDTSNKRHGTNCWDVDLAKQLFDSGHSLTSIGRHVGVKAPSVRRAFVKRGWIA